MKSLTLFPLTIAVVIALLYAPIYAGTAQNAIPKLPVNTGAVTEHPGDKYMLPTGAGTKDGSSWANAMDASTVGLQAGWDALQPGQTLWVGSGNYPDAKLRISSGGEAGKLKTIAGKDTGGGAPVFTSNFSKNNPSKSGSIFLTLADGSDYWQVQDIHVRDYKVGINSSSGGHEGARIHNFDVTGCREGISLAGGATPENPALGTHDIEISDCEFTNFTKRGIRLKEGNYDMRITNCVADAGGKAWATEPFQIGFSIEGNDVARKAGKDGAHEHDLTFTNCVALNSYNNAGSGYWNADGFCGERGVTNLHFIDCKSFDNTDGGWDFKSENITLEGCVSMGNKRNYRFWGDTTKLVNCLSAYSVYPGGSGSTTGLWAKGTVTIEKSTFYNNGISLDDHGKVDVSDSILAWDKENPGHPVWAEKEGLAVATTIAWDKADAKTEDPQLVNPSAQWEGQGDAFNSKKFGPAKGYFNDSKAPALPFHRTLFIVPGTPGVVVPKNTPLVVVGPKTPEQIALEAKMVPTIENAGFENDLTGWLNVAAPIFQTQTEGAAQGQKYLTVTAGDKRVEAKGKITGLVVGDNYVVSFKSRNNTSKSARIIVRQTPQSGYLGSTMPADAKEWTTKTLKFVAPANEVLMEISVRAAGTFDLDDFQITHGK